MRILITRPKPDADRIAALLRARGHDAIVSPLFEIRFTDARRVSLDGVQAMLATSANGVRALERCTPRRDIPVFAVGPETAAVAREAGFAPVKAALGDAAALADAVSTWADPRAGALLHVCGRTQAGPLSHLLSARRFDVRSEILYEAVALSGFSREAIEAFASGSLDGAMLFSPRSAGIFVDRVNRASLGSECRKITALCISWATAEALPPAMFGPVLTANRPGRDGMLDLLESWAAATGQR